MSGGLSFELSRAVMLWGCANGGVIALGAVLFFGIGSRADSAELALLGLLIGVEVAALSVALGLLLRVMGAARHRGDAFTHGGGTDRSPWGC